MATARSLGGGDGVPDEGSEREMARARRAITNPKPIRLAGTRLAGVGGLAPGAVPTTVTPFERVRIGGVSTLTVIAKISSATGSPTLQIHGQSQAAVEEDDTTGENNGRSSAAAALVNGLNIINDFVPAGEEFVDIELFSGDGLTIDWVDVLGQ